MAKVRMGILDGFAGKLGTVVGYISRGKAFMRAYTSMVHNPGTAAQTSVQLRFARLASLQGAFLEAIRIGFAPAAQQHRNSRPNNFMAVNWPAVTIADDGTAQVSFDKLTLATGHMIGVNISTPSFSDALSASVNFTGNEGTPGTDSSDEVMLFAFDEVYNQGILSRSVCRTDGTVAISFPAAWTGHKVHLYLLVRGAGVDNFGSLAPSVYVGSGTVG